MDEIEKKTEWFLKNICTRCYYRQKMTGLTREGRSDGYDYKACHYTLQTGNFREIEATNDSCPYFRPKPKRNKRKENVPPAWSKAKINENI